MTPINTQSSEWRRRLRLAVLGWSRKNARSLPWRTNRAPYRVWVSEVILQQTRAATAAGYYGRFLARFPTVRSLAGASERDVLAAWSGLGYYARARNLRRAALEIVRIHGGAIPDDGAALERLPGIGEYTAGAILSIAFGKAVPAVDGNVARVLSRLHASNGSRSTFRERARALVPRRAPGEWNEALMDLGAALCVPKAPRCDRCPAARLCAANRTGAVARHPAREKKRPLPDVKIAWGIVGRGRKVLLLRRARTNGLYAGLYEPPGCEVGENEDPAAALARHVTEVLGCRSHVRESIGSFTASLTHRRLRIDVFRVEASSPVSRLRQGVWVDPARLDGLACSGLVRRVLSPIDATSRSSGGSSAGSPSASSVRRRKEPARDRQPPDGRRARARGDR